MNELSILRQAFGEVNMAGRYAEYVPNFRAEEFAPGNYWILDGDTRVAAVLGEFHTLELVNWDPAAPRAVEFPENYHAPTAPGDRITLANWVEWKQETTSERNELTLGEGGATLTVRFEEWFAEEGGSGDTKPDSANGAESGMASPRGGMHAEKVCTFAVDPDYGYVVLVESHVKSPVSHQVEFANFLPEGVVSDRLKRWPFVLWQHPDGRILRWNQNNAGADTYGLRDHYGLRQIDPEGFLGYFGEEDRCPVAEFRGSNHPVSAATCANMLDEHLHWVVGKQIQPPQDEAGLYTYDVAFTLASLPGAVGAKIAEQAEPLDLMLNGFPPEMAGVYPWTRRPEDSDWPNKDQWPANYVVFRQGDLCDFTERVNPLIPDRALCFSCPENDESAPVSIVSEGGRTTGPCLRLQPRGGKVACGPDNGTSLHVGEGMTYQVTAWVKTDLHPGSARLRVWEWCYTPRQLTHEYWSDPVEGQSEWTKLSVEFTTAGVMTHCVSMQIVAEGEGVVRADEMMIEAV